MHIEGDAIALEHHTLRRVVYCPLAMHCATKQWRRCRPMQAVCRRCDADAAAELVGEGEEREERAVVHWCGDAGGRVSGGRREAGGGKRGGGRRAGQSGKCQKR